MSQNQLMNAAQTLFSQLYAIDIDELESQDKPHHRVALNNAYLVLLDLENKQMDQLLSQNDQNMNELLTATEQLVQAVAQEQKLTRKIQLAARGLEALQKITGS